MGDKAKRKKRSSTVFNDLKKQVEIEKPEEDEELVNYYKNKNFVAPVQRKFETIFEGSRRGFSEEGELNLGKGLDKRYIEEYQFWKQNDKDKNRKRKLKVQKQFKGRKNPKPKPLSAKDEKKLKKLIENVPEFETEPSSRFLFILFSYDYNILGYYRFYLQNGEFSLLKLLNND